LGRGPRLLGLDHAAARILQTLEITLGSGVGTLQTVLALPEFIDEGDLALRGEFLVEEALLGYFDARQFPLRDRHLLDVELLGPRLWLPFGF
jgi:hypothetical protein